jgi:Ca2+-binding EF-hand superfamily protein
MADEFMPSQPGARVTTPVAGRGAGLPAAADAPGVAAGAAGAGQGADPAAAGGLTQTATPSVNRMFLAIDTNNDGVINAQELRRAVASLKVLDADNDGNITLAEASPQIGPTGPAGQPLAANPVDQMLAQNDKNRDGQLTPDEIPPQMARMFPQWDASGDGIVTRDELAAAMANMANQFGPMMGPGGMNNPQLQMQQIMQFDRNGDGRLSRAEVPPQLAGMLQGADLNGDQMIDARELAAVMSQMGQRFGVRGPGGEFPMGDGRGPVRGPRGGQ